MACAPMTYEHMARAIAEALGDATISTRRKETSPQLHWWVATIQCNSDGRSWMGTGPDVLGALADAFVQVPELEG
jgi:hypothetical protein